MNPIRKINHIFILQSLPKGDIRTGEILYEEVIRREIDLLEAAAHGMTHTFFPISTKDEFTNAISYIQVSAKYFSGGVMIHFETHGSKDKDGLILSNGSLIRWKELVNLLRPINISTCNKLFVSLATCHGRELWTGIDPFTYEKSPYQAYISASREVYPDETAECYQSLFKMLINGGDLIEAYLEHEKNNSPFIYKDSAKSFEDTIKMYREGLDTDSEYRKSILDHPVLQEFLKSEQQSEQIMNEIIKKAFNEVVKRKVEAFNFADCN